MPLFMSSRRRGGGGWKNIKSTKGMKISIDGHPGSDGAKPTPQPPTAQDPLPCYMAEAPHEFDEEGKELDIDAQVWKAYVREADQIDKERVDGWNESMDVILIFAALFSAISTAFVIESYKSLKQDPTDLSSQTLLTISQTLKLIANASQSSSILPSPEPDTPPFQPSAKAICVNVLWFLSLSLSVAVSLISMLAKEWCLDFMIGRTGSPGAQVRRRQQRWDGMVKWKMEELITMLPSLIHLSLLLFAIGLCIFLWDVHYGVAIPVVIVTTFATSTYFACTVVPFLYDNCPYGTVLSRITKRFISTSSKTTQENMPQDKVTANALSWMLATCETPRSVDITLQSLAAADEKLYLETDDARVMEDLRQRLKRLDMDRDSEQNRTAAKLYARAAKAYLKIMCNSMSIDAHASYAHLPAKKVLLIQTTIDTLINQLRMPVVVGGRVGTGWLLDRCATISSASLAEEFMDMIQRDWHSGAHRPFSDLHCIFTASYALLLCCNQAKDLKNTFTNTLKMINGFLKDFENLPSDASFQQTVAPYLVLGTSWVWVNSTSTDKPRQEHPWSEALDNLWTSLMAIAFSNTPASNRFHFNNPTHSMWHLLTHPGQFKLDQDDCSSIGQALIRISEAQGPSTRMQSIYHAYYIQDLSSQLATLSDEVTPQVLIAFDCLRRHSPWEDRYFLPTTEIYIFTLKYLCTTSNTESWQTWRAYFILEYSPNPKCSPQLVQQLSSNDLIRRLATAMDSDDPNTQVFATAQLGVFLLMALSEDDRTSSTLNALEVELLRYPRLENDLERMEAVAAELETILMVPLSCDRDLRVYACRVLEAMLQRRSTPLPEMVHEGLHYHDISNRLRGIGSFVNYETERSIVYPDLVFDSEGQLDPGLFMEG
ncbi:unnamed protein product [Rhizoctonia solani]|uniref:DUF6535 domain-containing protein n=1 Tax=Rhizoctonia solani TaxID=456999 RepID=A0A8H3DWA8_9AGAM|nr:unnamed protein product [Rhizoctonia solani]